MKNRVILGIIAVIVVALALFYLNAQKQKKAPETSKTTTSHEFNGTLKEFKGNNLVVTGDFIFDNKTIPNTESAKEVEIVLSSSLTIKRVELILPTSEQLAKTGGRFDPETLERNESNVDIEMLKKDFQNRSIGIFAKSNKNINNSNSFTATELTYRTAVSP